MIYLQIYRFLCFWYKFFVGSKYCTYLLPACGLHVQRPHYSFSWTKVLDFNVEQFVSLFFMVPSVVEPMKKFLPIQKSWRYFSMFTPRSLIIYFSLDTEVHDPSQINFSAWYDTGVKVQFFSRGYPVDPAPSIKNYLFL